MSCAATNQIYLFLLKQLRTLMTKNVQTNRYNNSPGTQRNLHFVWRNDVRGRTKVSLQCRVETLAIRWRPPRSSASTPRAPESSHPHLKPTRNHAFLPKCAPIHLFVSNFAHKNRPKATHPLGVFTKKHLSKPLSSFWVLQAKGRRRNVAFRPDSKLCGHPPGNQ